VTLKHRDLKSNLFYKGKKHLNLSVHSPNGSSWALSCKDIHLSHQAQFVRPLFRARGGRETVGVSGAMHFWEKKTAVEADEGEK
jgi:hypothetical protein